MVRLLDSESKRLRDRSATARRSRHDGTHLLQALPLNKGCSFCVVTGFVLFSESLRLCQSRSRAGRLRPSWSNSRRTSTTAHPCEWACTCVVLPAAGDYRWMNKLQLKMMKLLMSSMHHCWVESPREIRMTQNIARYVGLVDLLKVPDEYLHFVINAAYFSLRLSSDRTTKLFKSCLM